MKVMGFVIIILGFVMLYIGITGSQHTFMATLKGSTKPAASGKSINVTSSVGTNPKTAPPPSKVLPPGSVSAV